VYFRELDGKWSTRTELRQPALDLRKQDVQCRSMYSQVVQQVALRGQGEVLRRIVAFSQDERGGCPGRRDGKSLVASGGAQHETWGRHSGAEEAAREPLQEGVPVQELVQERSSSPRLEGARRS
jgi:transposase